MLSIRLLEDDINLCNISDKNPCDPKSTKCRVQSGNYTCECLPGYTPSSDIDKCEGKGKVVYV